MFHLLCWNLNVWNAKKKHRTKVQSKKMWREYHHKHDFLPVHITRIPATIGSSLLRVSARTAWHEIIRTKDNYYYSIQDITFKSLNNPDHKITTLLVHYFSFSLFNQIYRSNFAQSTRDLLSMRTTNQCQADSDGGCGIGWAVLDKFNVIGRKHSKMTIRTVSSPPAFIDHLNAGNDVIRVKWDLGVISWGDTHTNDKQWK